MPTRTQLEKRLVEIEKERREVQKQLDDCLSRTIAKCTTNYYGKGCGKATQLRKLTYITTHYYNDAPYEEGWEESEGQFDCPHCGHRNRLAFELEPIAKLKHHFGGVVKAYGHEWPQQVDAKQGYTPPKTQDTHRTIGMAW